MKINAFKNRVLSDGKVWLRLEDCAAVLEIDLRTLRNVCDNVTTVCDMECISEDEFNYVFREYFPDAQATEQLTSYETLDANAGEILHLYPLKRLFGEWMFKAKAAKYDMTVDEYIQNIDFPKEVSLEKDRIRSRRHIWESVDEYRGKVQIGLASIGNLPYEKYGIELQHLTVVENGKAGFQSFYVGDGIFWEVMPDMMADDYWEDSYVEDDGTIMVPSADYSGGWLRLPKGVDRDFREHPVSENILYCIDTMPMTAAGDIFEIEKDGVMFTVDQRMVLKLLNPRNCPGTYFFEGIPDGR